MSVCVNISMVYTNWLDEISNLAILILNQNF